MTIYTHQDKNIAKTWLLFGIFFAVVFGLGLLFSRVYDAPEIIVIATLFAVLMNFFAFWFSHKIVLKMAGAKPVVMEEHRELWNVVENLSITAGLPMPKLYIINDSVPNAFATGRNKNKAVVAVTTGLLEILDRNELEGVIAHELSHIGNRDMLVSTAAVVLVGFVTLLSDFFLRITFYGGGNRSNSEGGGGVIRLVMFAAAIILAILAPIIASLIHLAISRKREFLADASGALLTRYPDGLASALRKISAHSGKMKKASNATAHLFISDPFGKKTGGFGLHKLFMTHPPIEDRIKALTGER